MPRTGGVYSAPAGTKGAPNTTIQSAKYNALVDDLVLDANAARPITAGGTGATSASAARTALGLTIGTNVQAYDVDLAAIADLTTAADKLPYATGVGTWALTTLSSYGRSLIDDVDAAAARATLLLGALAVKANVNDADWSGADLSIANGGTGASTASAALAALGGQPSNAALTSIAALTTAADRLPYTTAANTYAVTTLTAFGRSLIDDADAAAGRTTLGAAASAQQVIAGNGMTGGGALDADRTLTLGTPTTLTAVTTNAVTSTSHTHAVNATAIASAGMAGLAAGAVGSLALGIRSTGSGAVAFGATLAGSSITTSNAGGNTTGGQTLTGTWRCLGEITSGSNEACVWMRIS
ncbi:hypothetical protein AB3480_06475 [Rhizobium mongolense]|uniref:hypothetical protein n=1 Tax=Rhizobium mongolense TaxID=57676 RepID=UPI0034A146D6